MRKVIYAPMVSLDGFIERPNQSLDWVIVDEELHSFINDQQGQIDTYLFGRRMYEVMKYWETAEADPSNPEFVLEFARIWKRIVKIVYSKTLDHIQGNARLSRGNIVEEVVELKAQPGLDMGVGGATIAASLSQAGLIDEYRLFIHPVVLGSGTPMFQTSNNQINLRLIETRTFHSGVVMLRYERIGQE
jgi:dihydrofolate reductase